jgi:type II secretory pathway pseudopilin PulG
MLKIKTKIALLCSEFGKNRGSILLEVAVALSIIGMISGFFLMKSTVANRAMSAQKTKNNIEIVTCALASYLSNNGRLPHPSADGSGFESENTTHAIGIVPFNTLGISEKNTIDGNTRPLIYVVEPAFSNSKTIYETNELAEDFHFFCRNLFPMDRKIEIANQDQSDTQDITAFVLDTEDNRPTVSDAGKIIVKPAANTVWIRRNLLLVQYLKASPCQQPQKFGKQWQNTADEANAAENAEQGSHYNSSNTPPFDDF